MTAFVWTHFEPFICHSCGAGEVVPMTGAGRMMEFRPGLDLSVPTDFSIRTCDHCAEMYFSAEEADALHLAQAGAP